MAATSLPQTLAGRKILVATVPADGHVNPLTGLARYLKELGADVRWYTGRAYAGKLEQLGIPHLPFEEAKEFDSEWFGETFARAGTIADPFERMNFDLINFFIERAPEYCHDIERIRASFPFELLLADGTFTAMPLVKARLHVPVVAIGIMPLAESSANLAPYGAALLPAQDEGQRAEYAHMQAHTTDVTLRPSIEAFNHILTQYGLAPTRAAFADVLIQHADLFLQIGTPSFEYPRPDLGSNIRFVGALLPATVGHQQQPWYDERLQQYPTVVLVTQGTAETNPQKILVPTLEAFQGRPDTLVVATTGGHGTAALREQYAADNLLIEDFIPFAEVMLHAHVYVTNGGYGGVLLGLQHQLPLVVAGVYEAKNEVCARVGYFHLGINLQTETPSAEAIRAAVAEVLSNSQYRENVRRLAEELSRYNANEQCASYISALLDRSTTA